MKKRVRLFVFFLGIFCFSLSLCAQTDLPTANPDWQPIYLLVNGGNTMDGIEASFQLSKCNQEDVVYVKYVNHNTYPVKVEWFDAVFTQELKWINEERVAAKKSITLSANEEAKGECLKSANAKLVVKIKDFIKDKKDFKRYSASQLTITAVK